MSEVRAQYRMRVPCKHCDCDFGYIEDKKGQAVVRCDECNAYAYCAPKTETGRKRRSVKTTHAAIRPKQRRRILERANGCCEVCHNGSRNLHVGHVVSVEDGHKVGLTDREMNSDENLIAECEECNLGNGSKTMPIRLFMAILKSRQA